jgi:hypothetical protein|nr:MAG TPA: hypothetical protein [Caudoviricetes sp.]
MLKLKYLNDTEEYQVEFSKISKNICQLKGEFPVKREGFFLSRIGENDNWDYTSYKTIYRQIENAVQFSNNESVYVEPKKKVTFSTSGGGSLNGKTTQEVYNYNELIVPSVELEENYVFEKWYPEIPETGEIEADKTFTAVFQYIPTLDEVKEQKIEEMNTKQQEIIANGIEVTLLDGTVGNFSLGLYDQVSLGTLRSKAEKGEEKIPWHENDEEKKCRWYGAADMLLITQKAESFLTYHITYFRDLRNYIRSMADKESVNSVDYGVYIPTEYQSEVLRDMYAMQNA